MIFSVTSIARLSIVDLKTVLVSQAIYTVLGLKQQFIISSELNYERWRMKF